MVKNELPAAAKTPNRGACELKPRRAAMALTVQALDHLVVQVSNLEASAKWYERVLGMTREDISPAPGQPPRTEMKFGRQKINLRPVAMSKEDWFTADHLSFSMPC
jgi:hypothetical protein